MYINCCNFVTFSLRLKWYSFFFFIPVRIQLVPVVNFYLFKLKEKGTEKKKDERNIHLYFRWLFSALSFYFEIPLKTFLTLGVYFCVLFLHLWCVNKIKIYILYFFFCNIHVKFGFFFMLTNIFFNKIKCCCFFRLFLVLNVYINYWPLFCSLQCKPFKRSLFW